MGTQETPPAPTSPKQNNVRPFIWPLQQFTELTRGRKVVHFPVIVSYISNGNPSFNTNVQLNVIDALSLSVRLVVMFPTNLAVQPKSFPLGSGLGTKGRRNPSPFRAMRGIPQTNDQKIAPWGFNRFLRRPRREIAKRGKQQRQRQIIFFQFPIFC